MEISMVRHTNDDEEDREVGAIVDKMPHLITALMAVGGLIAAYFMTIGDFKMKDMELAQRETYLEQKVERIQQSIDTINGKLDSRFPLVDEDRKELRQEIDNLRNVIEQMKPIIRGTNKKNLTQSQ